MINHFGGQLASTVILYPAYGNCVCCFSTYALLFCGMCTLVGGIFSFGGLCSLLFFKFLSLN